MAGSRTTERRNIREIILFGKLYILLIRSSPWENEGTGYNCSGELLKGSPGEVS